VGSREQVRFLQSYRLDFTNVKDLLRSFRAALRFRNMFGCFVVLTDASVYPHVKSRLHYQVNTARVHFRAGHSSTRAILILNNRHLFSHLALYHAAFSLCRSTTFPCINRHRDKQLDRKHSLKSPRTLQQSFPTRHNFRHPSNNFTFPKSPTQPPSIPCRRSVSSRTTTSLAQLLSLAQSVTNQARQLPSEKQQKASTTLLHLLPPRRSSTLLNPGPTPEQTHRVLDKLP
jgi:hypothetical protein